MRFAEPVVVGFLADLEPHVLAQHELAGRDIDALEPVRRERHLAAEQLAELGGDRRERRGRVGLAFLRPAEVRHDHDARAGSERTLNASAPRRRAVPCS